MAWLGGVDRAGRFGFGQDVPWRSNGSLPTLSGVGNGRYSAGIEYTHLLKPLARKVGVSDKNGPSAREDGQNVSIGCALLRQNDPIIAQPTREVGNFSLLLNLGRSG